jgi:hypothetical protein
MYLILFISAVFLVAGKRPALNVILMVSFLGILFAGYFTAGELPVLFSQGLAAFTLGLPTCAWGLIFYTAIFMMSLNRIRK